MITSPARKISCRLTTTYAGFSGESVLLEELHKRGMALPDEVAPHLRAGDGMLFAWHTEPVAPWQDERWLAEMRRSLRPSAYARMILNEFVSPESKFIDLGAWDACVQPSLVPVVKDRALSVWIGVDASTKRDSTALVAVTFDRKTSCVRLIAHKVFTPTPGDPIDFENSVEKTLRDWHARFRITQILFDPYRMAFHGCEARHDPRRQRRSRWAKTGLSGPRQCSGGSGGRGCLSGIRPRDLRALASGAGAAFEPGAIRAAADVRQPGSGSRCRLRRI